MWKNVASQGAVSAHAAPTQAAATAVSAATRRTERGSSVRAVRANESSTFCGPSSARNVTITSARLRLAMVTMMAGKAGLYTATRNDPSPPVPAVYDRPRVTVVLALYD